MMVSRMVRLGFTVLMATFSAQAIMLGGVNVPKEKFIVYLCIGHSDMAGFDPSNSDGISIPHGWNYPWFSTKTWVLAKETPGSMSNGLSGNGSGGPDMPFLKAMAAAYPDYYFGVINNASLSATCRGINTGTNVSNVPADQNRYWKGATLYQQMITAANAIKSDATFGGMICMLGLVEATRTSDTVCQRFSDDIAQMATDFRTDLGLPNMPFIMGQYEAGAKGNFALTMPWPAIIDTQIKLLPSKLAQSATINSVGIAMFDMEHYSAAVGQPEFARRLVATIQSKSWFPPPSSVRVMATPPATARKNTAASVLFPMEDQEQVKVGKGLYRVTGRRWFNLQP